MPKNKFPTIKVKFKKYLLLLILFFLIAVFLVLEGNHLLSESIDKYKNKQEEKVLLENRIANFSELDQEYNKVSQDINMINDLLPPQSEIINLIGKIEAMATNNKLELNTKFESEPQNHRLSATFTTKGNYSDTMNFYQELSGPNILVNIKAVDMSDSSNMLENTKTIFTAEVYFD